MCIVFIAYKIHPHYPLIIISNRDEFYDRPTQQAHFWKTSPAVLAGQDHKEGGTWLGMTKKGRFSFLTNYRRPQHDQNGKLSRGKIVSDYLESDEQPQTYLERLRYQSDLYNGFNVVVGNLDELCYFSNRQDEIRKLQSGIYGLSNHFLDTPWPKLERLREIFQSFIEQHQEKKMTYPLQPQDFFQMLADKTQYDDDLLPDTGVELEFERALAPIFVTTPNFGTTSSTCITINSEHDVHFIERTYTDADSHNFNDCEYHFRMS